MSFRSLNAHKQPPLYHKSLILALQAGCMILHLKFQTFPGTENPGSSWKDKAKPPTWQPSFCPDGVTSASPHIFSKIMPVIRRHRITYTL